MHQTPSLPAVVVVEQNAEKVVMDISIPGMYISELVENDINFQRIELYSISKQLKMLENLNCH
ncbi:MAG: hypothetical protein R2750_00290 [Bacteroidales bacterium]